MAVSGYYDSLWVRIKVAKEDLTMSKTATVKAASKMDQNYEKLLEMTETLSLHTIGAYKKTIEALKTLDAQTALEIIKEDDEIDALEEDLIEEATVMIVRSQPVASDLRKILMIIRLAHEYERIADYAEKIAEYIILIKENDSLEHYEKNVDKLAAMLVVIVSMLELVFVGLKEEDKVKIKEAARLDDQIDVLYEEVMASLIQHIRVVDGKIFGTAHAILINKYIERAGDHTTNIAEEILFALKGRRYSF